ncbi:LysM peptidoglycan-binding domain-containing protein [Paenibacillus sp. LMG 31458]|uniref:LysM peptidoglycan-binding domain-containing protein n=1 Tax=Paenibacillus phytorum TaxID=2654977 RepID=A0ABX1XTU2_9BACL|nr:3D domain-containing protein [Paenibacillus phytorum]NOU71804.1 LysM peptidoglycan-binding domain-containing protein [Paenibacillus phytorum]
MFRKILCVTLTLPLLLCLWQVQPAYSYPECEDGGELPPTYSMARNAAPVEEAAQAELVQPRTQYQVDRGDTLFKIARDFGVTVDDLISSNNIQNPNQLTIGQSLTIPKTESEIGLPNGQKKIIKKVLNTTLTAYTAGFESTGKKASHPMYGITFSGLKAKEGRTIAVDPAVIPIGSTVFIDGIGIRKAEDIGSAIRGSRIDVFMNDLNDAQEFGVKKNVKVYLLDRENI